MATPSSGSISISDLQTHLGGSGKNSLGDYYRGGSVIPTAMGGASAVPTSGAISLSQLRNLPQDLNWTQATSPNVSGFGSSVSAPSLNLTLYLPLGERQSGKTFRLQTRLLSGTNWIQYPVLTLDATYGVAKTVTSPIVASKLYVMRMAYDGGNSVAISGYYQGSSTNYRNGGVYLSHLSVT